MARLPLWLLPFWLFSQSLRAFGAPTDPLYQTYQWNLDIVRMPWATLPVSSHEGQWTQGAQGNKPVVAVLDTGILSGHPDLPAARLLPGYDFVSDPEDAGDGDGRDADPRDEGEKNPLASLHGLHLAGIIAAESNNDTGIAGMCPICRILPVRVLGVRQGRGRESDIADAIRWSVGLSVQGISANPYPAQVLNLSFVQMGASKQIQAAIAEAIEKGALVVAAAGNLNQDAGAFVPGGIEGVITVGAATRSRARAKYSNHGPLVDLLAPGGIPQDGGQPGLESQIWSLSASTGGQMPSYRGLFGTSQAAAHVSAALALAWSIVPLRQGGMARLVRESADPRFRCDSSSELGCGAGLLNVEKLLHMAKEQNACGCGANLYCEAGRCVDPSPPLPSQGCAIASVGGPSPVSGQLGILTLVGAFLGGFLFLRNHRRGCRSSKWRHP